MVTELDDDSKAKVVHLILGKAPERALEFLATLYKVKSPKLRVGTVKKHRKTALAVFVHKDNTIYLSNSDLLYNPFVLLHEFYHHIRTNFGVHRGTERNADAFAKDFVDSYRRRQEKQS